jgi:hypothetical protein
MIEVVCDLIPITMAKKRVDLHLKCDFEVWNGFVSVCLMFETNRMRGEGVGLAYIRYVSLLLKWQVVLKCLSLSR